MYVSFSCPCGKKMKASRAHAGRKLKCPACKRDVTVPGGKPAASTGGKAVPATLSVKPPLGKRRPLDLPQPSGKPKGAAGKALPPGRPSPLFDEPPPVPSRLELGDDDLEDGAPAASSEQDQLYRWADQSLVQKATPWLPGDEARFNQGIKPMREGRSPWLVVFALLLVLAAGGAGWLFWPDIDAALNPPPYAGSDLDLVPADAVVPGQSNPVRLQAETNLRQIAAAMHDYHDHNKQFPSQQIGKGLSWRVALLPYLGEKKLYDRFKLDEPWDSKHNKALLGEMPKVFASVDHGASAGVTHYQVFSGAGTPFDGKPRGIRDFVDGLADTLLIVESSVPVLWTAPQDIPYRKGDPVLLGFLIPGEFLAAFADGNVRAFPRILDADTLHGLITPAGGELRQLPP